jgi:hypothetical protein
VEAEQRGDERAPPRRAGHDVEQHEDERRVGGVQDDARRVVPGRGVAEELPVEHVGHPRDRMPVRHVARGPGPADRCSIQTSPNERVLGDVLVVVVVREVVPDRRPEDGQDDGGEDEGEEGAAHGTLL